MFFDALPIARDIAVVLLVLQWLIIAAVPLFILIKITDGLRRFLPKVRPALRQAHDHERRLLASVEQGLAYVRSPFLWASHTRAALHSRLERLSSVWRK